MGTGLLECLHSLWQIVTLLIKDHERRQYLRHRLGVVTCGYHHQLGLPVYLGVDELYLLWVNTVLLKMIHQQVCLLGIITEDEPPFRL